ncbi:MAG: antitoxin MazE family protein, partial [Bifidobacteriaceae bacterium]|nr:antitoxin MazE family protein [Bifidobacteriaceae bacterium]
MALDAAARQKARRERLRAQGLRPVQLWVPDTKSPQFAA